jgi:hypothetical protein
VEVKQFCLPKKMGLGEKLKQKGLEELHCETSSKQCLVEQGFFGWVQYPI